MAPSSVSAALPRDILGKPNHKRIGGIMLSRGLRRENLTLIYLILLRLEAKLPDQRDIDLNFYGYAHDEVMTQIGWLVDQGCVTAKLCRRTLLAQVSRHFGEPTLTERGRAYLDRLRQQYRLQGR
jgi:hypothetical protein